MKLELPWVEKYRPERLSDIVGQSEATKRLQGYVKTRNMPNLLFSGPAGVGKTSASVALAKELFGADFERNFLELNASDERGIDVVRSTIKDFARTLAFGSGFKIIFLDESDALTGDAQTALRRTMEKYTKTCRFVLSCVTPDARITLPNEVEMPVGEFVEKFEQGKISKVLNINEKENREENAKACYSNYLKTGKLNDDIISAAIQLAQLDPMYRALYIDPNMGRVEKSIVDEMRDMLKLAKRKDFTARSYCALNPVFGEASYLVGGADADLIIDDTLIDIKTIKSGKMYTSQFHQLIGYFILNQLGGVNGKKIKINRLGIYFSRYGELVTFSTENIVNDNFPRLVKWFRKTAENAT